MKTNIHVDVKMELQKLDDNILRAANASGKGIHYVTEEAAKMFTQSAAIATDPNSGSPDIPQKMFYRRVEPLIVRERSGSQRQIGWKVPFRTSTKRGIKAFSFANYTGPGQAERMAKEFSFIQYRGVAKAGWWANLMAFGVGTWNFKAAPKARQILNRIASCKITRSLFSTTIEITNKTKGIGGFGAYAAHMALYRTNNRMNWWIKSLLGDIKKSWKAA